MTLVAEVHAREAWYDDRNNVAMLIRWLDCKGLTVNWTGDDYAYAVEKPWKWDEEWRELQAEFAAAQEADCA